MSSGRAPGKYIGKKMLRAFIGELGHEREDILIGACQNEVRGTTAQIAAGDGTEESEEDFENGP